MTSSKHILSSRPRRIGQVSWEAEEVHVESDAASVRLVLGGDPSPVVEMLARLDGSRTVREIADATAKMDTETVVTIVDELDKHGLLRFGQPSGLLGGKAAILELEDLTNRLLHESIYKNVFWINILDESIRVPENVLYGMCIENYHFLFRESFFDSPVLSLPGSTRARGNLNAFYAEEIGHDKLLLKALQTIGVTSEELFDTMPLPETAALCSTLSYWARTDPLFFMSTLGVLEGKDLEVDSYIQCCRRHKLPDAFVEPILTHAKINMKGEHGNLTRILFDGVNGIDPESMIRLRGLTHVFVELYNDFYSAIWHHYSTATSLLRRISDI